jgi:hypothetical protein
MTIKINKQKASKISEILAKKLQKKPEKGNLENHFGKLKRDLDGLTFQLEARKDED